MKKILLFFAFVFLIVISVLFFTNSTRSYLVSIKSVNNDYTTYGNGLVYKKVDDRYYILTLYHILANSNEVYINNKKAQLLYYDDYKDIAVLSISDNGLKVKKINKCSYLNEEKIYIYNNGKKYGFIKGEKTIDVANIYGNSMYKSIVLDLKAKPGDSGTAVFNKSGKIIGLVSVIDTSFSYAIPICDAIKIANSLENGELNRPNLGVIFKNSESDVKGVLIYKISDTSPIGSFKINSIITSINNVRIKNISEFRNELYKNKIGDSIEFEYYRDGKYYKENIIIK